MKINTTLLLRADKHRGWAYNVDWKLLWVTHHAAWSWRSWRLAVTIGEEAR